MSGPYSIVFVMRLFVCIKYNNYVIVIFSVLQISGAMYSFLNSQMQHHFIQNFESEAFIEIQQAQRIACNWAELAAKVNGYDNKHFDSNNFSVYPTNEYVANVISDAEMAQNILQDIEAIEDQESKAEQVDTKHNDIVDSSSTEEKFPIMDTL